MWMLLELFGYNSCRDKYSNLLIFWSCMLSTPLPAPVRASVSLLSNSHAYYYSMAPLRVIIIGGGLAGLSLSIQLAVGGWNVLLLEKETYPFHRVCGEYISMEAWDFLCSLGVPLEQWHLPLIKRLQVTAPDSSKHAAASSPFVDRIPRATMRTLPLVVNPATWASPSPCRDRAARCG